MPANRVNADVWQKAQEATRALVEDAVHRGYWRRDELRARLQGGLSRVRSGDVNRLEVACGLLADLTTSPDEESFTYDQEFFVPHWLANTLEDLNEEQRRLKIKSAEVELSSTQRADEAVGAAPDVVKITATVTLFARTPLQAWSRGEEYAHDALSRLRFLALLRCAGGLPPSTERRMIEPGTVRFARGDGSPWERSEVHADVEPELEKAAALGFVRVDPRAHECRVQDLPGLAVVNRGKLLDGQARLTRALHWLSIAEDRGERPGERLSHAWVALEHLVTDGGESKLPVVLESVPSSIALCHLRATFGAVYRDALAALHIYACEHVREPAVKKQVDAWLGQDASHWYKSRPEVVSRFKEDKFIDDVEALQNVVIALDRYC